MTTARAACLLLPALAACERPGPTPEQRTAPAAAELIFVRGGVIAPGGLDEGRLLPGDRALVARDWSPGESVTAGGITAVAPRRAECVGLFQRELGDVSRLVAMGASPDTALAFSPDGQRLAVGTHLGEVLVLDGWSGAVIARRRLAETMVKWVDWSPDGATLYAAEQSPDATVHAFDAQTLASRWGLRLADRVETSPAPAAEDLFGVYTLPAAFGLRVLPDGGLVVAATHAWTVGGAWRNLGQLLKVSPAGEVVAAWPERPAEVTLKHPVVDADGGLVAVAVSHTADGAPPAGLPVNGVQVLKLEDLSPVGEVVAEPLAPWFEKAELWEALDVSGARGAVLTGYSDGRLRVVGLDGELKVALDSGAPVMAGEVPIHAGVGWGRFAGDGLLYLNTSTYIPYGAASPELRPPTAHPNENTLWATDAAGEARWTWSGEHRLQGLTLSPDGRALLVGAGARETDERRDLYGGLVFDLAPGQASGEQRLAAFCATEGPVFFRHALADDGRVALAEHPYIDGDGAIRGAYRVTVLR